MAPGGNLDLPPGPGKAGEAAAVTCLQRNGLTVLERNYRTAVGEIDVVAHDEEGFVFVEVKTRRNAAMGVPEEGISAAKAERLVAAAQTYLEAAGEPDAHWRIDLVAVEIDRAGRPLRIEVFENAVTA